jgi:uncharacterized protein (TIGR02266 family)
MSAKSAAARGEDRGAPSAAPASQSGAVEQVRRVHSRHDIELEVTLESESNFYMGLTENLSAGGLFIATHTLRPLGTSVEVSFRLPGSAEPVTVVGTVRWVREYSDTSDTGPGLGVRFDDIAPQTTELIAAFLASRAPLFHDED